MPYSKIRCPLTATVFAAILVSCSAEQTPSGDQSHQPTATHETTSTSAISSPGGIMAEKNGIQLTDSDFEKIRQIDMATKGVSYLSISDELALRNSAIEAFNDDPRGLLDDIRIAYAEISLGGSSGVRQAAPATPERPDSLSSTGQQVASGHYQLRQSIETLSRRNGGASPFKAQAFDTPSVNRLRSFIANSQLVNQARTEYYSGKSVYTFCADGTFHFSQNSSMSVGAQRPGGGGYEDSRIGTTGHGTARGYWDAYTENGNDALLIFSSDPGFAEESLNNSGLLAVPIATYQEDVVQIGQRGQRATPDMLLRRNPIGGC